MIQFRMNDFKLKMVLTLLASVVFSFIFIILAFVLPAREKVVYTKKPSGMLEKVSHSIKNK